MNSTDRDKARHVVGHHNKLWNDVIAYPQHLTDAIATALAEVRKEAEAPYAMCRQVQKRGEHSSTMCACVLAMEEAIRAEVRRETWEAAIGVDLLNHAERCCIEHGCKYGDEECPVTHGVYSQASPCKECEFNRCQRCVEYEAAIDRLKKQVPTAFADGEECARRAAIRTVRGMGKQIASGEEYNEFHALIVEVIAALEHAREKDGQT